MQRQLVLLQIFQYAVTVYLLILYTFLHIKSMRYYYKSSTSHLLTWKLFCALVNLNDLNRHHLWRSFLLLQSLAIGVAKQNSAYPRSILGKQNLSNGCIAVLHSNILLRFVMSPFFPLHFVASAIASMYSFTIFFIDGKFIEIPPKQL